MSVAQLTTFLMNGYELACYLKSFTPEAMTDALDATVLCNNYKSFQAGFKDGSLSAEGIFSADSVNADDIYDVLKAAFSAGTNNLITASFGQAVAGSPAIMMSGAQGKFGVPIKTAELIMVTADFQCSDGMNFGVYLLNEAIAAGTVNGTSVDNGAATANGGVFHVHLQNDTATDVDTKLQHSTNGSSWADVSGAVVNDLSAAHAYGSVTVAAGTTINRYIRAVSVVTGGDATKVTAAFARR